MEYNFSLFFGLAIQAYETTLVCDDTPWDRCNNVSGSLTTDVLTGMDMLFSNRARCGNYHRSSALTDASAPQVQVMPKPKKAQASREGQSRFWYKIPCVRPITRTAREI